jgi:hypothetical protein
MQLKSHRTAEQIARKHRMDVPFIKKQLQMGIAIEHEHTQDKTLATDIALQHLDEFPDYYTRLKKMEADAKKHHKKFKDVKEDAVTDLQRGITELPDASYASDNLMRRIMKKRKMTVEKFHNNLVDKNHQIIDTWEDSNVKEGKGLWDNIHARREKGLPRKKPGQKGYPETLDVKEGLKQARKNVGASKCWPGKVATKTKMKDGKEVPDCRPIKESSEIKRYCPKCAKEETRDECRYGQKYWDMFSMPITLKDYTPNTPHPGNMPEEKDHEYSMARSELNTIMNATKRLKKKMGKGEGDILAWVQSKITKAADYIDTAADYIDSAETKKESVNIEDANGNHYVEFIDIVEPEPLKASRGIGSRLVGESISNEPKLKPGSGLGGGKPVYEKGKEPKPTGAKLPLAKKKTQLQVAHYEPNLKTFQQFMSEAKKSEMKCNSPKAQPVGDSLTGKSHVVKACENGNEKLLRFGQRGVKGSPKKKGESKEYASRRHRFQTRHAKNISKGKMSAAYWSNLVKW